MPFSKLCGLFLRDSLDRKRAESILVHRDPGLSSVTVVMKTLLSYYPFARNLFTYL